MRSHGAKLHVLYEDNHLLAVNKPAGLPTMGVAADRPSLLTIAKEYIRRKYNKLGNVYVGIVSRLDAPVTGVVLLARTSKAAARLNDQFRNFAVEKLYLAVVEETIVPAEATLTHYLRKDERHRKMHATRSGDTGTVEAVLSYRMIYSSGKLSLVEVRPKTGRKHQIRVQLAKMGHPLVGDRKYGSNIRFASGIALHARRLGLEHPVRNERLAIAAPVPDVWHRLPGVGSAANDFAI